MHTYPRETVKLSLVASRQLGVHRRQCRLLTSELFIEVAGISSAILRGIKM